MSTPEDMAQCEHRDCFGNPPIAAGRDEIRRGMTMSEYGLDAHQFREHVVRPALQRLALWSQAAENLVHGTALKESNLRYVRQLGSGPAVGPFQMEPETHLSLWVNGIPRYPVLRAELVNMTTFSRGADVPSPSEMIANWIYAAAMCRVHYYLVPKRLPAADDALGMAKYWKTYYNSVMGKGTVDGALPHFQFACGVLG